MIFCRFFTLATMLGKIFPGFFSNLSDFCGGKLPGWMGEGASSELMTAALKLALCFLACGLGSYGLSYSAGQLSPNLYTNSVLLNAADILGYLVLLGADTLGSKTFQTASYLLASLALLLCGLLQPGSGQIVACAMAGRICLNVSFGLVYVALAEIFPESSQKMVLPLCCLKVVLAKFFYFGMYVESAGIFFRFLWWCFSCQRCNPWLSEVWGL